MQVGDLVEVLPPFKEAFPSQYGVIEVKGEVATLETGTDFAFEFLHKIGTVSIPAPVKEPITKLSFLRRMTAAQRIAIRAAAQTDPILADAMQMLDAAQDISTDDPDTIALVHYCAQQGLVAASDVPNILA